MREVLLALMIFCGTLGFTGLLASAFFFGRASAFRESARMLSSHGASTNKKEA